MKRKLKAHENKAYCQPANTHIHKVARYLHEKPQMSKLNDASHSPTVTRVRITEALEEFRELAGGSRDYPTEHKFRRNTGGNKLQRRYVLSGQLCAMGGCYTSLWIINVRSLAKTEHMIMIAGGNIRLSLAHIFIHRGSAWF